MSDIKCPFSEICKYYDTDAYTCNVDNHTELKYCGKYKININNAVKVLIK